MKTYIINKVSAGRTLGRYLEKQLPGAPESLLHKALRNNKIKLNGKKPADLKVRLEEGDELRLFFTDDQFADFCASQKPSVSVSADPGFLEVAYEDENLVIFVKPAGVLSQKGGTDALSANEYGLAYLNQQGIGLTGDFVPGVLNRLDRNTTGLILMAKNLAAAQRVSAMLADHSLGKYYQAIVSGKPDWPEKKLTAFWTKDSEKNTAAVSAEESEGAKSVSLIARRLSASEDRSLIEVKLLTGKSHQIRAQLSAEGHPLVGDYKYGFRTAVPEEKQLMLCACKLVFPDIPEGDILADLSLKTVEIPLPPFMKHYAEKKGLL